MKTFKYELGHIAGSTMTVAELRDGLAAYPDDMPVFATWEGVNGYVDLRNASVQNVHKGTKSEACPCLVIDVEDY